MTETILITGATGRIGRVLTAHFRRKGWTVVAVSRSPERLADLEAATADHGRFVALVADMAAAGAADHIAGRTTALGASPHHLVNNARDLTHLRGAGSRPSSAQWAGEFKLGVEVPFELATAFANRPDSVLQSVVNIASMYGVVAVQPGLYEKPEDVAPIHYGVVKAALIHLTRELSVRLAPRVRVNAVSFGGVIGRTDPGFAARYSRLTPLGRMLDDDDLAGPVDFLTSPGASAVTGHNLLAEGGWTTW